MGFGFTGLEKALVSLVSELTEDLAANNLSLSQQFTQNSKMEATTITNLDWFKEALSKFGETLDSIEKISLSDHEMSQPVSWGGGGSELGEVTGLSLKTGRGFLAWSRDYVYFQVCYDGHYEWIRRVPRNPPT